MPRCVPRTAWPQYAEASDLQLGGDSPYYTDSHRAFLLAVRGFVDAEIAPDAAAMEEAGEIPSRELYAKMGQFGLLGCRRWWPGTWLRIKRTWQGSRKTRDKDS